MTICRALRRAAVIGLIALVSTLLGGAAYQRYKERAIRSRFSPPGVFVAVDHYSLHLWCLGDGSPTVVIDPGGYGGTTLYAADLVETLAPRRHVCVFDPPGQGWSEAGSTPGAIPERYRAFRVLMTSLRVDEPVVLVAESSGAHVARLFTAAQPALVRGLVLVDPAFDDLDRERSSRSAEEQERAARLRMLAPLVSLLSQFGLHRPLLGPTLTEPLAGLPAELRPLVREQLLSRKSVAVLVERGLARQSGLEEVRSARVPRRLPLVVLTAGIGDSASLTPYEAEKLAYHRELASLSERGRHFVVPEAPHAMIGDRPQQVARAVETAIMLGAEGS